MATALPARPLIGDLDSQIQSLEHLLRRKTLEIEFLQEELHNARARKRAEMLRALAIESWANRAVVSE
jgi:hypothetical protein